MLNETYQSLGYLGLRSGQPLAVRTATIATSFPRIRYRNKPQPGLLKKVPTGSDPFYDDVRNAVISTSLSYRSKDRMGTSSMLEIVLAIASCITLCL